jgi:hypothetical protein
MQKGDRVKVQGRADEDYRFEEITGRHRKKVWCYKAGLVGLWEFPIEYTDLNHAHDPPQTSTQKQAG